MKNIQDIQLKRERFLSYYKEDPENQDIICQLVDLETQLGEFDDARKHLAAGLDVHRQDPALQFRQATLELACGSPDKASAILQAMLEKGVDNPVIRFNLGYACLSAGEYERAKALFDSVDVNESEIPLLSLMQSRTLHHLGDVKAAIEKANHYLAIHPDSSEALGILALLHLDEGAFEKAEEYAVKAHAVDPENREALLTLGSVALEDLEMAEAGEYFSKATQNYPESGRAWSGAGLVHMMAQELDQAERALEKAVRYMPGHIGTWHALAWCQIVLKKLEAAEASFNSANEIDHNFGETHGGLAVIAALRGDWETADRTAKIALRLDPESFAARFAQSLSLNRTDPSAAQALLREMLMSSPTRSDQSLQAIVSKISRKRHGATNNSR